MDTLERQVEVAGQELLEYKRRCESLQRENATLLSQLKNLQKAVGTTTTATTRLARNKMLVKEEVVLREEKEVKVKVEPLDSTGG